MSRITPYVGLDVHKDSINAAVFEGMATEPAPVDRLPSDFRYEAGHRAESAPLERGSSGRIR